MSSLEEENVEYGEMTYKGKKLKSMSKKQLIHLAGYVMVLHLLSIAEKHGITIEDEFNPTEH